MEEFQNESPSINITVGQIYKSRMGDEVSLKNDHQWKKIWQLQGPSRLNHILLDCPFKKTTYSRGIVLEAIAYRRAVVLEA